MYESKIAMLQWAIGFFVASFVLSLIALKYKKPDGKWFSPIWRLKENYEPAGVALYSISIALMLVGFILLYSGKVR